MRKPRPDAVLLTLPEETQRAIFALEGEGLTLEQIRSHLAMPEEEGGFGRIQVSIDTISRFLRHWRAATWRERLHAAAQTANEVVDDEVRASGEVMDEAILAGIREWIMDTLSRGQMQPKDAKSLVGLILKGRQQSMDNRKLELLEKKAAAFDQVNETAGDDTLTPEERIAKIRKEMKI